MESQVGNTAAFYKSASGIFMRSTSGPYSQYKNKTTEVSTSYYIQKDYIKIKRE